MTHYVVYGAGGVGCVIGARLQQAGLTVTLIARGEHARALAQKGLTLVAPDATETLQLPVVGHPREISFADDTVVLLCMKSHHTAAALVDLAGVAPASTAVVCVQNGVANERQALRYFAHTYASVVILPALFLEPGEVVTHARGCGGVLDTGCYPQGIDARAERITADLTLAGFSARPDPAVMRLKYAKLLTNLFNVLQAALPNAAAPRELRERLRGEALACYAAAGIDCASSAEMRTRRRDLQMAEIDAYPRTGGSTWQSLARGSGDLETAYLNGEVCLLGRLHGVPTPANDTVVEIAREMIQQELAPGAYRLEEILDRVAHADVDR